MNNDSQRYSIKIFLNSLLVVTLLCLSFSAAVSAAATKASAKKTAKKKFIATDLPF